MGDVKRIFSSGSNEKIKNGLRIGRKSPRVFGYLIFLFSIGFLHSILYGCLFVLIGLFIHCLSVTLFFQSYVWIHLRIDMKDKKLELWTTTPNCFLVATTKSDKVVGCISYKRLSSDTAEMHHVAVDSEFRRQ